MTVHLSDAELSQTSIMNQHRLSTVTVIIMLGALKLNVRVHSCKPVCAPPCAGADYEPRFMIMPCLLLI
jgi:hypothetical protein